MSAVAFVVFMVPVFLKRRQKSKLNQAQFAHEWQELQQLCKDKKTWPLAIINADKLLDNALKKCNYKIDGPEGAAKLLEMKPSTLRDRIKKLGIERPK